MTTLTMPNYSYGENCFQEIPQVLAAYGFKKIVFIGGEKALASAQEEVKAILLEHNFQVTGSFIYGKDSTQANIDRLANLKEVQEAELIFAFGGGQALDTAKMVAKQVKKQTMTFPTICSNCSAGTAIAVIYKEDHSLDTYGYPDAPLHIFINTRIIAQAPVKYFWAGIADGISKAPEVARASQEAEKRGVVLPHTAVLGRAVALSSKEAFYTYGRKALDDVKAQRPSLAVEEIALAILISTAYASNLVNQPEFYYNSCHAHAFYNGSTAVPREGEYLHGIVVAFGVMVLHAYYDEEEELRKVAQFNKSLGFPTTLAELGLTIDDLDSVLGLAMKTSEYQHTPFDRETFHQAILKSDSLGRNL
ncbi:iron-containing alcohol dehydrogenase family protein [Streptococcus cuniculipharyngis]|uniref:Glycerol dehydrogenase n=1 Tax=Streptococcus cuniculipharyngis TaxID=1562651 RepID=A0A5C5SDR2_9STRE|nr:iron-containing alcohol dehydrogenase family protein [Streptococcus cuniculipharyngis]TWS98889.1 iron-containing alcohol dehydrogenase family protein [Streptococcus cuniculipharyngis]